MNADHFGAAVELESFKYLREQVYFGAPAFYLMVGLNMFKGFFLLFLQLILGIQSSCADLRLTFHSVLNGSGQADGVLCGQPVAAVIVYLTLKICTHLKAERATFCFPNLTLQFQRFCAGINI